jgi:DNA-directed RNA polymerase specialized sigma24 family protein
MTQLTELLARIQAGDAQARDALFATAYSELHRLAHARLRDGGGNTVLDTTCLMRYFGGYSEQEIAETLEVTERTVQRDWEKARLILAAALR